jgi:thiamine kinase-like enzyme
MSNKCILHNESRIYERRAIDSIHESPTISSTIDLSTLSHSILGGVLEKDKLSIIKSLRHLKACDLKESIESRIGSNSANGIVYKIRLSDIANVYAALKMMPVTQESKDEIYYAKFLSNSGNRVFPSVFGFAKCDVVLDMDISASRKIAEESIRKNILLDIAHKLKEKHSDVSEKSQSLLYWTRLRKIFESGSSLDFIREEYPEETAQWIAYFNAKSHDVYLLISEIFYSDIRYYVNIYHDESNDEYNPLKRLDSYRDLIKGVLSAMEALFDHGLVHQDIHFGNFLVRKQNNGSRLDVVIHDFGESKRIDPQHMPVDLFWNDLERIASEIMTVNEVTETDFLLDFAIFIIEYRQSLDEDASVYTHREWKRIMRELNNKLNDY